MIDIVVRYLGGLRMDRGMPEEHFQFPEGSTLHDLKAHLLGIGLSMENDENVFVLDGFGLTQYPPDQLLKSGQVVSVFPHIAGGGR
jgi:molybdopterin converting factor small subunit